MLQLEASLLRLPSLHSGSSPAFPFTYRGYLYEVHVDVQFSGNIYAHLKFTVYGRKHTNKQTHTRVLQCSPASVGLAQARPNYFHKTRELLQSLICSKLSLSMKHYVHFCRVVTFHLVHSKISMNIIILLLPPFTSQRYSC